MGETSALTTFRERGWPVAFGWIGLACSVVLLPFAPAIAMGLVIVAMVTVLIASDSQESGRKGVLIALTLALAAYLILTVVGIGLWLAL